MTTPRPKAPLAVPAAQREVVLVTASDEAYAIGLAVTVRSALNHLGTGRRLRLFVLDGGLRPETRGRLEDSWEDARLRVEWRSIPLDRVRDAPVDGHGSPSVYSRLLMPELLPGDVSKAIYLDCDTLVKRDLGRLWDQRLDGAAALAVREPAAPMMDSEAALGAFPCCKHYLAEVRPIPNYREFGLSASAAYFNSGVLVADVAQWRRARVTERALDCLRENRRHVRWWDQYALNVLLADRWREIDPRWNHTAHYWAYPSWRHSPFDRRTFETARDDPWIVHFTSAQKPWAPGCPVPLASEFLQAVGRTEWRGIDPSASMTRREQWKRGVERRRRDLIKWLRSAPQTRPWASTPAHDDSERIVYDFTATNSAAALRAA